MSLESFSYSNFVTPEIEFISEDKVYKTFLISSKSFFLKGYAKLKPSSKSFVEHIFSVLFLKSQNKKEDDFDFSKIIVDNIVENVQDISNFFNSVFKKVVFDSFLDYYDFKRTSYNTILCSPKTLYPVKFTNDDEQEDKCELEEFVLFFNFHITEPTFIFEPDETRQTLLLNIYQKEETLQIDCLYLPSQINQLAKTTKRNSQIIFGVKNSSLKNKTKTRSNPALVRFY